MPNLSREFLDSLEDMREGQDLSFLQELSVPETIHVNADAKSLHKILKLVQSLNDLQNKSGMQKWFDPDGPYPISALPKHEAFFAAGSEYPERLFMASNRCLAEGTLVATPTGPVEIQNIAEGDWVYDRYGKPTRVVATWDNGEADVVSLQNRNKEYVVCTPNHEMDAVALDRKHMSWNPRKNKEIRIEAGDLEKGFLVRRQYVKAPLGDVRVNNAYILGAMLGDGCCTCGNGITKVISSADDKVPNKIVDILGAPPPKKAKGCYNWHFKWEGCARYDAWMKNKLCHEKVIDINDIKTWDRESSLEFAAGLLDTDGSLCRGADGFTLSFCNQSKSAVDAFAYLCLALWNERPTISIDERARYVNGPVYQATVRNPHAVKRIAEELSKYVVHKYKTDVSNFEGVGKRSRPEALFLTPKPAGRARVYDITVEHPEHFFLLANGLSVSNSGKTICGLYEDSCHLTGIYPSWWTGKTFDHPVDVWVVGPDAVTVRDTLQKDLVGAMGEEGTGILPAHLLGKANGKQGVVGAIDKLRVKHATGGWSSVSFKNYKQDLQAFMGAAVHVVHLDEEAPIEIWNECNIRTATTDGIMYATFTPLKGYSRMVVNFCKKADFLMGAKPLVASDFEDEEMADGIEIVGSHKRKAVIQCGWDDAPWLTEEVKKRLLEDTPEHLREARSKGIPSMEGGSVFTTPLESVLVEPFAIPDNWPRMYGLDVGWNVTSAVWCALDPNTGTVYAYDEHYQGEQFPQHHAHAIKLRGEWVRGVIDPAADGRSQKDGTQLMRAYKELGLRLMPADNSLEAGLHKMNEMFSTGTLKIFKTLRNLQKEYMLYKRKLNGSIDPHCDDHAIDGLRYCINNMQRMTSKTETQATTGIRYAPTHYDV